MTTPDGRSLPTAEIDELMAALRAMWDRRDPAPTDLAERISFALALENIEIELARMEEHLLAGSGARGEERVRTVTFVSRSITVMVTLGEEPSGTVRLDGWVQDGAELDIDIRIGDAVRRCHADSDGRFALEHIPPGLIQLIFQPTRGGIPALRQPVVTPAIQL
jgi:hypothetical protein